MTTLITNARVLTLVPAGEKAPVLHGARRGRAMSDLGVVERGEVLIRGERILGVGPAGTLDARPGRVIDAGGRVLMPGFVDCHTHACFAGDRLDEWELKRSGATYLEILRAGGGIMSTVRATRAASEEELAMLLRGRLQAMLREGTTTIEVKSGYGLGTFDELKMLRAIRRATVGFAGTVVPTALLGHAIDAPTGDAAAAKAFVDRTLRDTLPAVSGEFPFIAVDAYCEKGAWSFEDCVRLFERARAGGHAMRVHADQFTSLGMTAWACGAGFASVDHLESTTPEDAKVLAESSTVGVVLPACGFHVDGRYADARRIVDLGGAVAIASNYNPGSAPCRSMAMAAAIAVRQCGLTPAEAITASTVNAAAVLGLEDRGVIAPGKRADLVLLTHRDERMLAYEFGSSAVETVIVGGVVVDTDAAKGEAGTDVRV